MKVIKSKKGKSMKVKCPACKRKLKFKPKDCHYAWPHGYKVDFQCPVCGCLMERIEVKRKFWESVRLNTIIKGKKHYVICDILW